MANSITTNEATGVLVPSTESSLEAVVANAREAFGSEITTDPRSLAGLQQQMMASERDNIVDLIVSALNDFDFNTATGITLDMHASLSGLNRNSGVSASATVVFIATQTTSTAQTVTLPSGFIVVDSINRSWVLAGSLVLTPGIPSEAQVFEVIPSPEPIPANSITKVLNQPSGWSISVNNPNPGIIGRLIDGSSIESDASLRRRIRSQRTALSPQSNNGIKGRVSNVANVIQVEAFPNNTAGSVLIDGVNIPANSILVVVRALDSAPLNPSDPYCGLPFTLAYDIATAMIGGIGAGILRWSVGDLVGKTVTINYTDPFTGRAYIVVFARAEPVTPTFIISATSGQSNLDIQNSCVSALTEWADSLSLGQSGTPMDASAIVSAKTGIKNLNMTINGSATLAPTVNAYQYIKILASNVTVIIS